MGLITYNGCDDAKVRRRQLIMKLGNGQPIRTWDGVQKLLSDPEFKRQRQASVKRQRKRDRAIAQIELNSADVKVIQDYLSTAGEYLLNHDSKHCDRVVDQLVKMYSGQQTDLISFRNDVVSLLKLAVDEVNDDMGWYILDTDNVELQIKQWVLDDQIKLSEAE